MIEIYQSRGLENFDTRVRQTLAVITAAPQPWSGRCLMSSRTKECPCPSAKRGTTHLCNVLTPWFPDDSCRYVCALCVMMMTAVDWERTRHSEIQRPHPWEQRTRLRRASSGQLRFSKTPKKIRSEDARALRSPKARNEHLKPERHKIHAGSWCDGVELRMLEKGRASKRGQATGFKRTTHHCRAIL